MNRVGKTYQVIGAYNPLGLFPARVYPVFRGGASPERGGTAFRQLCDQDGYIRDFQLIDKGRRDLVFPLLSSGPSAWIDGPALNGFAHRSDQIEWARGNDEFLILLKRQMSPGTRSRFLNTPLIAVEICRALGDSHLEAVFAGIAARRMATTSRFVANNWIRIAKLSQLAKARCETTVTRQRQQSSFPDFVLPSTRIAYLTPAYVSATERIESRTPPVRHVSGFSEYFDTSSVRRGDIVFLSWREFSEVDERKILDAGRIGVRFAIFFDHDINPKHRILQNLAPCQIVRSTDKDYLNNLITRFLKLPIPDLEY